MAILPAVIGCLEHIATVNRKFWRKSKSAWSVFVVEVERFNSELTDRTLVSVTLCEMTNQLNHALVLRKKPGILLGKVKRVSKLCSS